MVNQLAFKIRLTPTVWMMSTRPHYLASPAIRNVYAKHFHQVGELPDLVVVMNRISLDGRPFDLRPSLEDPVLAQFSEGTHELALNRPDEYTILRRTGLAH